MKPEHHQLLHDLMDGADPAAQRDTVLAAGQRVLRRKRHLRHLTHTLAVTAFVGLAVLVISGLNVPRQPAVATRPASPGSYGQEITDDELLALFPGTPVGLVKIKGKQRLIFPRPDDEARFILRL
ncbi:MAG TPA: hypothetical protein P5205_11155 [Candidatus Paceibacterota bacterium]|nr:hypothetical protein [Verrucomicrobiota bacterium]HSA10915.1 hypothetical protein [Candidatus Paceibacterota bacterium]